MMTKIFGEQKDNDDIQNKIFDQEGMKIIKQSPTSLMSGIENNSI